MSVIRLPSWGEVLRGPWAIRLRSGGSGVWLMRGEADSVPELECRFLDSRAARTTPGALEELGQAFQLEVPLGAFGDLPDAVTGDATTIALLVLGATLVGESLNDVLNPLLRTKKLSKVVLPKRPAASAEDAK